ncbi:MAG: hypothetical protein MK098_13270 [Marinovum sp.]|nr:hypothetical protein [Marinovum sp.]
MPLEILLGLVIGGIAGIAVLLHFTGRSKAHEMATPRDAKGHWNDTYPDHPAQDAMLSTTGQAALIRHREGFGVVWSMGQDVAARMIDPKVLNIKDTARHLVLRTTDYTAPRIRLVLTADERPVWRATLESDNNG